MSKAWLWCERQKIISDKFDLHCLLFYKTFCFEIYQGEGETETRALLSRDCNGLEACTCPVLYPLGSLAFMLFPPNAGEPALALVCTLELVRTAHSEGGIMTRCRLHNAHVLLLLKDS